MDFTTPYNNSDSCKEFVPSISDYLFDKEISEKLKRVNFIGILCDGSTDKSVCEQMVLYLTFKDPDTHLPMFKFFHLVEPEFGQDADGIKKSNNFMF